MSKRAYWNERYADQDLVWGIAPNRFVEEEFSRVEPGVALDLACGEGRNAIWLAAAGWRATAVDFSRVAIARGRELARKRMSVRNRRGSSDPLRSGARSMRDSSLRPRRTIALLAALCVTLLASGCLTVGQPFPASRVADIRMGETTRAEIEQWFGSPWRSGVHDGMPTWTYGHYRYSLFGPARTRDLVVRFDTDNRVASYTFNETPARPSR